MDTNNNLEDFTWESEETFEQKPEEKKEVLVKKEEQKKEQEEIKEEEDFFKDFEKTEQFVETVETNKIAETFNHLKEIGFFKHTTHEGDLDEDLLVELQEQEYEAEVTLRLTDWATKDLDEDAQAFIKFKREGGNTQDFFQIYSETTEIPTGDIEDEDYQDNLIRHQLKKEGWDNDEIEDRLEYLTENGKKEKVAQKYDVKIKQEENKIKEELLFKATKEKEAAKIQKIEFKETLKEALSKTDNIKGFKITETDKNKILLGLTKEDQEINSNKTVTSFQKRLSEVFQNTEETILLAKLLFSNFDMTSFEKAVGTKITKEIKNNLEQRKIVRSNFSKKDTDSLADLFN